MRDHLLAGQIKLVYVSEASAAKMQFESGGEE
jgi:hypothetical protein